MVKRPNTAKALFKELEGHIKASKASLNVKFGDSLLTLHLPDAGIVTGDDYGAMMIGGKAYLLERDRKGHNHSVKVIEPDAATLEKVVRQLLPEPEEPEEVKEAKAALAALKAPEGYKYAVDAKTGALTVVEDDTRPKRTRAPKGSVVKPEGKPDIAAGLKLRNKKDELYTVQSVELNTGYAILVPEAGGEDVRKKLAKGDGTPKAPAVTWNNWKVV